MRPEFSSGVTVENGILIERDISVVLRDGVTIYTDVFRPDGLVDVPAIVAWGPYGKRKGWHGHPVFSHGIMPEGPPLPWRNSRGPILPAGRKESPRWRKLESPLTWWRAGPTPFIPREPSTAINDWLPGSGCGCITPTNGPTITLPKTWKISIVSLIVI